ncbi:tetratricopeptide repeat protein [Nocardia sp. NPDC048505]|uniref:tetratricopeptide repeat protein n=1 Tax=unclassified Nocardia TaxID=2637762 RepID=UPI0033C1B76A
MFQRFDSLALRGYILRVQDSDGAVLGTAFRVTAELALTCAHVVGDRDAVVLVPADALTEPGTPAAVLVRSELGRPGQAPWPFPDLAVLHLTGARPGPCLPVLGKHPAGSQPCHAYGFPPRQRELPTGSPRSFDFEGSDGDGYLLLKAGQAAPGLSGAPLICPVRRAVVGIVAVSRNVATDLGGWATPIAALTSVDPETGIDLSELVQSPDTATWLDRVLATPNTDTRLALVGGKIAIDNAEAAARDRTAWQRVLPADEAAHLLLDRPWGRFTRLPKSNPSDLLLADSLVVPYLFRDSYLDQMQEWCEKPAAMAVGIVGGRGGSGKTRFAIELCRRMADFDWIVGFWVSAAVTSALGAVAAPRLVVADYSEDIDVAALRDLLADLQAGATTMTPVRLLLLTRTRARGAVDPLDNVRRKAAQSLRTVIDTPFDTSAAALRLEVWEREELYTVARQRFAAAWQPEARGPAGRDRWAVANLPDLAGERYATALDVLFEAFDAALTGTVDAAPVTRPPVQRVLDHEIRFWQRSAPGLTEAQIRLAVALATFAGADDRAQADRLLRMVHGDDAAESTRQATADWLAGLYHGTGYLNPLRPDRLGEALIGEVLREQDDGGFRLLETLVEVTSEHQLTRVFEVLARMVATDAYVRELATETVVRHHAALLRRATGPGDAEHPGAGSTPIAISLAGLISKPLGDELAATELADNRHRRDLSASFNRLGELARGTGQLAEAERLFRLATDTAEELAAAEPENSEFRVDLSFCYDRLGELALGQGRVSEARQRYRAARDIRLDLRAVEPESYWYRGDLAASHVRLGDLARFEGKLADARRLYWSALDEAEYVIGFDDRNPTHRDRLGTIRRRLGIVLRDAGRWEDAERFLRQSLDEYTSLARENAHLSGYRGSEALAHLELGLLFRTLGLPGPADRHFTAALGVFGELVAAEPDNFDYRHGKAWSAVALGRLAGDAGLLGAAADRFREARDTAEDLVAKQPSVVRWQVLLGTALRQLGTTAAHAGRRITAQRRYQRALGIYQELASRHPHAVEYRGSVAECYAGLARVARDDGNHAEAMRLWRETLEIKEELRASDPGNRRYNQDVGECYAGLARLHHDAGEFLAAERCAQRALDIRERVLDTSRQNTRYRRDLAESLTQLGDAVLERRKPGQARACYLAAMRIRKELVGLEPENRGLRFELSQSYAALARFDQQRFDNVFYPLQRAVDMLSDLCAESAHVDWIETFAEVQILCATLLEPGYDPAAEITELLEPLRADGRLTVRGRRLLDDPRARR